MKKQNGFPVLRQRVRGLFSLRAAPSPGDQSVVRDPLQMLGSFTGKAA